MRSSGWAVLFQSFLTLGLAFAGLELFNVIRDRERPVRYKWSVAVACVIVGVLWLGVTIHNVFRANVQQREEEWVKARAQWLTLQISDMIGAASDIRYRMLTNYESDRPDKQKLKLARSCYTPLVNQFRESASAFLRDEAPGAGAPTIYDFGFGKGTTEWNVQILSGTVLQLTAASNSAEVLAARSAIPRTHDPNTAYGRRTKLSDPRDCPPR